MLKSMHTIQFLPSPVGGRVDNSINNGEGPYIFRLNGQNHHLSGSLLPMDGTLKFSQNYIYNTKTKLIIEYMQVEKATIRI